MPNLNHINRRPPGAGLPQHVAAELGGLPRLLAMNVAPKALGLSRSAIYRAASQGKLLLRKNGRSTLVDTESALGFITSLPAAVIRPANNPEK